MLLTDILNKIRVIQVSGDPAGKNITAIEYDSRKIVPGAIFFAIKGFKTDGHLFIQDSINKKAAAVVIEDESSVPDNFITHSSAVKILVADSRKTLAEVSSIFYHQPSDKINLTGITGTNGKTTTSFLYKSILETAGFKTGLIGTIENYIGSEKIESQLTTPESNDLNSIFVKMRKAGCDYAVMEVSSHSLALNRVYKIHFSSAIFTNITPEHLDFHGDFNNYLKAKKILFDMLPESSNVIFNSDDLHSVDLIKDCLASKFSFGTGPMVDFRISDITFDLNGTFFNLHFAGRTYPVKTSLVGDFNAYNAASAFAAAKLNGISEELIIEGIKATPQVPGRFEVLTNGSRKVVIDYSHTPDSLEKALLVIRKLSINKNPVITVFGCGGNRDRQKRPVMGKIATELSDQVIITSDNPRFEKPESIIEEIRAGIVKTNYKVIENREEAIESAIKNAGKNAIILIAGKGHEQYQEAEGIRKYFSDKETAKRLLGN